jgi:hypothetical protein
MGCAPYRKSSMGPRALIWVPIEPTSCFGFFRQPPLGPSTRKNIGQLDSIVDIGDNAYRGVGNRDDRYRCEWLGGWWRNLVMVLSIRVVQIIST